MQRRAEPIAASKLAFGATTLFALAAASLLLATAVATACGTDYSPAPYDAGGSAKDSAGSSKDGGANGCSPNEVPSTSLATATITLKDADFGGSVPNASQKIGFDLDDKCTTASSTDVCGLTADTDAAAQIDGLNGIDNSFGKNVLPVFQSAVPGAFVGVSVLLKITDGTGTLVIISSDGFNGLAIPLVHANITTLPSGGGTISAIIPTAAFVLALEVVVGHISPDLCNIGFDAISDQIDQASDILVDGTNVAGPQCDGISLGVNFTNTAASQDPPDTGPDPCAADGGTN